MKEIIIEINKNGKIKVLYKGFQGNLCFEEAKKLYQLLKNQGIDISIEQITPTQEYYIQQKTKEVLKNGN